MKAGAVMGPGLPVEGGPGIAWTSLERSPAGAVASRRSDLLRALPQAPKANLGSPFAK